MTEVEKIIKKGIINEDFLKPETICDFYVDENRKKLWAVILDMLFELDMVCKKYNLHYYACGGTVLGAVRHKGFIPWDDDLDVYMFRDEYEELQKHADEFKAPYFLQTPYTDKGYYFSAIKIRNSNTSSVSEVFAFEDWNMGIYLDIFPMDEFIISELPEYYEKNNNLALELSTYMRKSNPYLDEKNRKRVASYCGRDPIDIYEEIHNNAKQYAGDERCDCFVEMIYTEYQNPNKKILLKDDLKDIVYLDFHGFRLPNFNGYENHLKRMYGDYMKLPPIEERGIWHAGEVIDPDTPYKTTVNNLRKKAEDEHSNNPG